MANEAARAPLQDQLDDLLRDVNDFRRSTGGRFETLEGRHTDLHGYVAQAIEWQGKLDKKIHLNTRAVEGLAITTGKVLTSQDEIAGELKLMKKVLFKMAKKMGL